MSERLTNKIAFDILICFRILNSFSFLTR